MHIMSEYHTSLLYFKISLSEYLEWKFSSDNKYEVSVCYIHLRMHVSSGHLSTSVFVRYSAVSDLSTAHQYRSWSWSVTLTWRLLEAKAAECGISVERTHFFFFMLVWSGLVLKTELSETRCLDFGRLHLSFRAVGQKNTFKFRKSKVLRKFM